MLTLKFLKQPPVIISVGGSLIVPNGGIDTKFLSKFNEFIRKHVKKGKTFFIVAGGGKTARHYIEAGRKIIGNITTDDLDWLGIHSTRLNAHLLRTIFKDIAHPRIIKDYDKKFYNLKKPVVIGAGWKPGWSTDYDAVMLAKHYGSRLIINLTSVYWVYDKDPKKHKDAKPIKRLTWEEMESIVGTEWKPGTNAPFDPVAAQLAKKLGLTVIVTNGHDFRNLDKILEGDAFKGTVIMPFKIDASFYDRDYYTGKKGEYKYGYSKPLIGRVIQHLANFYRAAIIKLTLKPKSCLDVGCGTGLLVKYLRKFGVDAYGVEISSHALELADEEVKPFLYKGDILKLPFEDNKFDLVITFDVLEHLERSKIKKAVQETIRVSNKYVLHKIYTTENLWITLFHGKDPSHLSVLPKKFWQNLFSSFENVSILKRGIFKLPSFFESVFLLKKKSG